MDDQLTCDHCGWTGDRDEFAENGDHNGDPTCLDCLSLWAGNHDYRHAA